MRTETEEKLLKEIDTLLKAGVIITMGEENHGERHQWGFAKIENGTVRVFIGFSDTPEQIADYLVEAGELTNKVLEIRKHELDHPDFRQAIANRIYGNKRYTIV